MFWKDIKTVLDPYELRKFLFEKKTNPRRFQWNSVSIEKLSLTHRAARHLIVGAGGTVGYFIFVALLVEKFFVSPVLSVIISYSVLVLYTYLVNRRWVYNVRSKHIPTIFRFSVLLLLGFGLNTGMMYFATEILAQNYLWGLIASAAIVPMTNFAISYLWVFR